MTRNRLLFFALSLALVLPLLTGTFFAAAARGDDQQDDSLYKYLAVFSEVLTRVRDFYVDKPDLDQLIAGALDGTTDALDPFSVYVPPEAVKPYLAAREVGTRHSGLLLLKDNGVLYVAGIEEGSPAAAVDLKVGDIVSEIGGESTRVMPLWQAQEVFAGDPGSEVDLKVIRFGEQHPVAFTLGVFEMPSPRLDDRDGVEVLRIPAFGAATVEAVKGLLAQAAAAGHDRLLVDLRGVAMGDPEVAYRVGGLFVGGDLGVLKRRDATVSTFNGGAGPGWSGKVAVLVSRGTLGAAELLATVLRQKLGAELVGERTFGYAGRQGEVELASGGRLLYTDAFYTGPDGEPLRSSLVPDQRVDDRSRTFGAGEGPAKDPILERGLELLRGDKEPAKKAA